VATTTSLSSPTSTANSGDQIVLTATITPATTGAVPTGSVDFTISGTSIGSAQVQNDGTASLTITTLPAGSDSIVANYGGDATYAGSASTPFVETINAPPAVSTSIAKSTLPAQLVSGAPAKGAVTLTVTNQSGSALKGKTTLAVFASTTDGIDGSSILLGQAVKNLNIVSGKQLSAAVPLHITSATLPAGSYKLFARATDPSGNSADSPAGEAVAVAAPFVALSETITSSSLPTSATANSKAHGAVVLNVTNGGNVTTSPTTAAVIYATTNGTVDASAVQLASVALPLRIKPGKPGHAVIPLKQIPALAAGVYTVVAQLTDQNQGVSSVTVGSLTIAG
jgi:hypothetical protein